VNQWRNKLLSRSWLSHHPAFTKSGHEPLDELIRAIEGAHTALLDLEELAEEELDRIHANYERRADRARADLRTGVLDRGVPDVGQEGTAYPCAWHTMDPPPDKFAWRRQGIARRPSFFQAIEAVMR
jgi:hypothetical protein